MNNKLKLSVAISALNEEKSIKNLVESLLSQNSKYYILDRILIASDGSDDRTVDFVKQVKSRKVRVYDFKKRMGKAYRLSNMYREINSDVTLVLDADLVISSKKVIDCMVYPFTKSSNVFMTGGNSVPLQSKTFVGNSIHCTVRPYLKLRDYVDSLTVGPILAYRTSFIKSIKFPADLYAEDVYGYLSCLSANHDYKYCKGAIVYYKVPDTLSEHINQNTKFTASPIKMREFFTRQLMEREDYIPRIKALKYFGLEFVKYPTKCLFIFVVNLYCRLLAVFKANKLKSTWKMVHSTKILS